MVENRHMLRVTCSQCQHRFSGPSVEADAVAYQQHGRLTFKLEFSAKVPCPQCQTPLGVLPISAQEARGIPIRDASGARMRMQATPKATSQAPKPAAPNVSSQAQSATTVRPFRPLASKGKSPAGGTPDGAMRLSVEGKRVVAYKPGVHALAAKPPKSKVGTFFLYAASALLVSSLTALSMFVLREAIDPQEAVLAFNQEVQDELEGVDETHNHEALGGPTEDLVVDQAEDESVQDETLLASKYKKNLLHLPELHKMSSGFGIRLDPFSRKMAFHGGIDFKGKIGDKVFASMDGKVTYAGYRGRYGKLIVISHGKGLETRYAHLSRIQVKRGQTVKRGDLIGAIGNTGRSTGPHLHLEVVKNGQKVNPLTTKLN